MSSNMRVAIGSDHAGFELKHERVPVIEGLSHWVLDAGAQTYASCDDCPDCAVALALGLTGTPKISERSRNVIDNKPLPFLEFGESRNVYEN